MRSYSLRFSLRRLRRARSAFRSLAALGLAACGSGLPEAVGGDGSDAGGMTRLVDTHLMEWAIAISADTVDSGPVTFHIRNGGTDDHYFRISGVGTADHVRVAPDGAADLTLDLAPGSYILSCSRDEEGINHEGRGMRATLIVRE